MRRRQVRGGVLLHKLVRGVLRRCRAELWRIFHDQLDLDGNGRLDSEELMHALQRAEKEERIMYHRGNISPAVLPVGRLATVVIGVRGSKEYY